MLKWTYKSGVWTAESEHVEGDGSCLFHWRIVVLPDGKFTLSETDQALIGPQEPFFTFTEASDFCQVAETILLGERK